MCRYPPWNQRYLRGERTGTTVAVLRFVEFDFSDVHEGARRTNVRAGTEPIPIDEQDMLEAPCELVDEEDMLETACLFPQPMRRSGPSRRFEAFARGTGMIVLDAKRQ